MCRKKHWEHVGTFITWKLLLHTVCSWFGVKFEAIEKKVEGNLKSNELLSEVSNNAVISW